jgi:hypothetical protein
MSVVVSFEDKDVCYSRVVRASRSLNNSYVKVGFPEEGKVGRPYLEGSKHKRMTTMSEVATNAARQEFGSENRTTPVPARPFMGPAIDGNRDQINIIIKGLLDNVISGSIRPRTALRALGEEGAGLIKRSIEEFSTPGLKPRTIQKKGSDKPLIDRGQMVESVSFKVVSNGI